jgi:hypothetical protein
MAALASSVGQASSAVISSNMALNLLLGGSLSQVWSLINTLQITTAMSLF